MENLYLLLYLFIGPVWMPPRENDNKKVLGLICFRFIVSQNTAKHPINDHIVTLRFLKQDEIYPASNAWDLWSYLKKFDANPALHGVVDDISHPNVEASILMYLRKRVASLFIAVISLIGNSNESATERNVTGSFCLIKLDQIMFQCRCFTSMRD